MTEGMEPEGKTVRVPYLRRVRLRRLFSQEELAKRAGLSPATVARIEKGKNDAYGGTVRKLAQALDVELEELTGERRLVS